MCPRAQSVGSWPADQSVCQCCDRRSRSSSEPSTSCHSRNESTLKTPQSFKGRYWLTLIRPVSVQLASVTRRCEPKRRAPHNAKEREERKRCKCGTGIAQRDSECSGCTVDGVRGTVVNPPPLHVSLLLRPSVGCLLQQLFSCRLRHHVVLLFLCLAMFVLSFGLFAVVHIAFPPSVVICWAVCSLVFVVVVLLRKLVDFVSRLTTVLA